MKFCINNNCSLPLLYFHAATSHLPRGDQLQHITEFGADPQPVDPTSRPLAAMLLSCELPPVPTKLIKRIQDDLFVEMFELLPERLISADYNAGDGTGSQKQKPQEDLSILQWIQCFGIYIAIISQTEPERTADLLGYQQLINNSSQQCQEGHWVIYDRRFHLKVSATRCKEWASIDINIWNIAFPGRAFTAAPVKGFRKPGSGATGYSTRPPPYKNKNVCLDWNDDPSPSCPYPDCRFEHRCYRCICNPRITDNQHKAIFCPYKGKKSPLLQQPPVSSQSRPH